ncbi:MAG: prepilin-type N-terminal cleavage/methylation domain-containing protein [Planctomycetes bacterium]|nr:prepilin-type N-terminal cleavage/methylation domain-containing protein [Planctomycetota bacterium]
MRRFAFTLVELLVVISIIALLISILLPALHKARTQAKRVRESSNTHQLITTIHFYAQDAKGELPRGYVSGQSLAWTYKKSFQTMHDIYGLPLDVDAFGCSSWSSINPDPTWWYTGSMWHTPWIYWGGRPDETTYKMITRLTDAGLKTSDTLTTCFSRLGGAYASWFPHIDAYHDIGQTFNATPEKPTVMCVGFIDGAAMWKPFTELDFIPDGAGAKFYYARTR